MRINDLQESRRNPKLNNRAKYGEGISELLAWSDTPGCFVSFTEIPKLGINPKSGFNTPIGVYCYPLDSQAVVDEIEQNALPFAGESPFINVLRLTADEDSTIYFGGESPDRYKTLNDRTARWLAKRINLVAHHDHDDHDLSEDEKLKGIWKAVYPYAAEKARPKTQDGIWWNFTRLAAMMAQSGGEIEIDQLSEVVGQVDRYDERASSMWTRLMLDIGILAVIDDAGNGIIHNNEPYQAVFFSTKAFRPVDRFPNPRARIKTKPILTSYEFRRKLTQTMNASPNSILNMIDNAYYNPNELKQYNIASKHPYTNEFDNRFTYFQPTEPVENYARALVAYLKGPLVLKSYRDHFIKAITRGLEIIRGHGDQALTRIYQSMLDQLSPLKGEFE